ncbi:MAG: putative 4-hydroxybenzoate polyprenyltransferase [Candidatus Omnitrophica bacterium]|nr:putative 4-hydroxybenzoate polyprenyltransferase [Candidatus Omnitrophota bacterium]
MERVRVLIQGLKEKAVLFFEMIKFEHTVFALPFAYVGLFLAEGGLPRFPVFFWVTLAMFSFRSMSMGLNRLIDARIDADNPRTQHRAIPAGKLKKSYVWFINMVCLALFELSAYRLSQLCFLLSPIPVFWAWFYPWTKRFTWLSHFILGMILGMAPYGAWLASRGEFSWIPGFLMLGIVTWVAGFDIIYSLQDREFDIENRLYSFPACFGVRLSIRMTWVLHGLTIIFWAIAGMLAGCGVVYLSGIILVVFFLLREHWLIHRFGLKKVEEAFFPMNAVVSVSIFLAVVADLCVRRL